MDTADRIRPEIAQIEAMLSQAEALQKTVRESAEHRNQFLRMLRACYNKALKDPDTRMPSYLHAALENVMVLIPEPASAVHPVFAQTLSAICPTAGEVDSLAAVNAYVEAGIRKDQRERHEGKPEHDLDVVGRALRAGT